MSVTYQDSLETLRTHHQRRDGSRDPEGLAAIPFTERMLGRIDTPETISRVTLYRAALSRQQA